MWSSWSYVNGTPMPASPDPDLAVRLAKSVADIYGDAATHVLATVANRLARDIERPGWAERKLLEIARLRDQAQAIVDRLIVLVPRAVERALADAYAAGAADAAADGIRVAAGLGRTRDLAVRALAAETVGLLQGTHGQIVRTALDVYRSVVAEASRLTVTGMETRRRAAQAALDRFATRGVTGFVDSTGRRWQLDSYAEMATRTAVGRAQVAGTLDRFVAAGLDLVIVSDHAEACDACRPWEQKVLSVSGLTPRGTWLEDGRRVAGTVAEARKGGLLHAGCRHSLTAYLVGLAEPERGTADPEGDAARQEQRRLDRGVRQWRLREAVALDDMSRLRAGAKVREWQAALRAQIAKHDVQHQHQHQHQRERIGSTR
jgi:hypothetical protein